MSHVDRASLDQLPPELQLEIASHIGFKDLARFSSCSRRWRSTCLPLLFHAITLSGEIPNAVIIRFLAYNAACYGHLIKEINAEAYQNRHDDDDDGSEQRSGWTGVRDESLASLISFATNLWSLQIRFAPLRGGYAMVGALTETAAALYTSPRR